MSVSAVHHPHEYRETINEYRRKLRREVEEYATALSEMHEAHEQSIREMETILAQIKRNRP